MENNPKKMRIISGKYKGKSIKYIKSKITRPLRDSVKESIFNILTHSNQINIKIEKSTILDLYSGIGSFGLECVSRGAKKVIFIEYDKKACQILNENLITLTSNNKAFIFNTDTLNFLKNSKLEKFNIFFFDPPFADKEYMLSLELIKNKKIYNKKNVVIIHRKTDSKDNLDKFLEILTIREYGKSKIIFGQFT